VKIAKYSIQTKSMKPLCVSPSVWGTVQKTNEMVPLMFFKKPKWMHQDDFIELVKTVQLYIPANFEFKEK
jgi:hypothetical protein